jgi:hypothetical protein
MQFIKAHKIHPVYLQPGDSISLDYAWEDGGEYKRSILKVDDVSEPVRIDTILVYRLENQLGLRGIGRAMVMGEDDGTYSHLPLSKSTPVHTRGFVAK